MSMIKYECVQGKVNCEMNGTGKELIALFACIHEDLREKFKDAGKQELFDRLVGHIITVTRGE